MARRTNATIHWQAPPPPALYEVAPPSYWSSTRARGAPHNPYYDIVKGNNCPGGVCSLNPAGQSTNGYKATAGYDVASGLGTFNALQLAWALNWWTYNGGDQGNTVTVSITSGATLWPALHTSNYDSLILMPIAMLRVELSGST